MNKLKNVTLFVLITVFISVFSSAYDSNFETTAESAQTAEPDEKYFSLYVKSADEIEMYSDMDAANYLVAVFSKKAWGTWSIIGWYSAPKINPETDIPAQNLNQVAGGSTDWEYVFKVSGSKDGKSYFSGGNHANEVAISIRFNMYPENAALETGSIYKITKLIINEVCALNLAEYNIYDYCTVNRSYTFKANSIELSTDFRFTKDIWFGTSYVAMFPILKEYGRYFKFGGNEAIYSSAPTGSTASNGSEDCYIGKEKALSAIFWGDSNPDRKFRVWVNNAAMLDNYKNELNEFVWDINIYENKLYFSKYDTAHPVKIRAGTVWKHKQGWELLREE